MDNRRNILKMLLRGHLTPSAAASELLKATGGTNAILIVVQATDGLYSIGDEHGLTESEMRARTKGTIHVIVSKEVAQLGAALKV
jgi:hypothetical protein